MKEFVRGNAVTFSGYKFVDVNGDDTVPEEASLRVRYLVCGEEKIDEVAMTEDGGLWSVSWDSSPADPGTIFFNIRAVTPPGYGDDGQFRLKANPANPRGEE